MMEVLLYLLTGGIAGTLAGLLGIGGGVIIVPVLVFVFQYQGVHTSVIMHVAIGTSLATIVITSLFSIRAHQRHGAIRWDAFRRITPGILAGGLLGAAVADSLPSDTLRLLFAPFMVAVALQLVLARTSGTHRPLPGPVGMFGAGTFIGTISALFGIGGGTISVPFLAWCGVAARNAVATSAAIGFPIALSGTIGFVIAGWSAAGRPEWSIGYVTAPAVLGIVVASSIGAPYGAKLTHRLPDRILRLVFAGVLIAMAIKMFLGASGS